MKRIFLLLLIPFTLYCQRNYLSNLNATKDDPVYTAYASAIERSDYKIDQAYSLSWFDPEKGIGFESFNGGNILYAFELNGIVKYHLKSFYTEPVITASYPDLVKFYCYPYKGIRVEASMVVYSSGFTIQDVKIFNETGSVVELNLYPVFQFEGGIKELTYLNRNNAFHFHHRKERDGWMKDHSIPLSENLQSVFMLTDIPEGHGAYLSLTESASAASPAFLNSLPSKNLNGSTSAKNPSILSFRKSMKINPDSSGQIRIIRGIDDSAVDAGSFIANAEIMRGINFTDLIEANEKIFSRIPEINFPDEDTKLLYYNAFSLIRQCMMRPEGESNYNYYVFSREPKWGWGYGGQVFHESLVMLAYAFMDPESAMSSQRVYFERQRNDGYINYRTGPYLNEEIVHNGEYTSSAPWFNYINYEIYKISGDKKFLRDAYNSGKKFYKWYTERRDSNGNGLSSWGGHAELESVRDARVAVWDKVGWASNFEGPDLNSMLVMEEKSLAAMASILRLEDESGNWERKSIERSALVNKYLWDEESQFYYNVNKNDQSFTFRSKNDLKIKEIIGFLPLWAGITDMYRTPKLIKSLLDEKEFWRRYGIPTLSAKDDYYNPIGYWNGPVWIQWQYLIFRGLLDNGYKNEAVQLAGKVMSNVINQLKTDHYFWEFYSADDHQAGWNKSYIWTGIIARFLIDINSL